MNDVKPIDGTVVKATWNHKAGVESAVARPHLRRIAIRLSTPLNGPPRSKLSLSTTALHDDSCRPRCCKRCITNWRRQRWCGQRWGVWTVQIVIQWRHGQQSAVVWPELV